MGYDKIVDMFYSFNVRADITIEDLADLISDIAISVVRCKDCKYRDPEDYKCDSGALERMGCIFPIADDYFCAWGERREDAQ